MLTTDDLEPLRGVMITHAETERVAPDREMLLLHLDGGAVLAITAVGDELDVSDILIK